MGPAHRETLIYKEYRAQVRIDENVSKDELEWVIPAETAAAAYIRDNVICYGLMIRKTDCDPKELSVSKWWAHSHGTTRAYAVV